MDLQIYIQPAPDASKYNFKATQSFLLHQTLQEFHMLQIVISNILEDTSCWAYLETLKQNRYCC